MNFNQIQSALQKVSPEILFALMSRLGLTATVERAGLGKGYSDKHGQLFIVPADPGLVDYGRAVFSLLESLTTDTLTLDDLFGLLDNPRSYIFRFSISGSFSLSNCLPINYGGGSVQALGDLLRFTAAGAVTRRDRYTDLPPQAKDFARGCRLGQTEHRSFTLKVFCPSNPLSLEIPEEETIGNIVMRSCLENVRFLNQEDSSNPQVLLPATLNQNVANAIERLRPPVSFDETTTSVWFGPGPDREGAEMVVLPIDPFVYDRAHRVSERIKRSMEAGEEVLQGFIVDLHKDRPREGLDVSRAITMDIKYGVAWRKLTMVLIPSMYKQAVAWHESDQRVLVRAVIEKRSVPWSVSNIFEFRAVNSSQNMLFE